MFAANLSLLEQMTIQEITEDERRHLERLKRRWDRYGGDYPKPLKTRSGQPDDNIAVNKCKSIVNKGVAFLFGGDLTFDLDPQDDLPEERYLRAVWTRNHKMTTLTKHGINGGVAGHAFLKIQLTGENTTGGDDGDAGRMIPRLIVLEPSMVWVDFSDEDIGQVLRYRIQWNTVDSTSGRPIVRRQLIEPDGLGWVIIDQVSRLNAKRWETIKTTLWPFPFPPIVDNQNLPAPNEFWGMSDLEDDVIHLNEMINLNYSDWMRIRLIHGHPRTVAEGISSGQTIEIGVDRTILTPPGSRLYNLEMTSEGEGNASLGERLEEALHEVAQIPAVATGKIDNLGPLSGVALQILYQPLIEKTNVKRQLYGDALRELNRRLLAIGGYGDQHQTIINWPNLLPRNERESAETASLWNIAGVSQDTTLSRNGFDPEHEREMRAQEQQSLGETVLRQFERGE